MNKKKSNTNNTNTKSIIRNIDIRALVLGLMVLVIAAGCIGEEKNNGDVGTSTPQKTSETTITPKITPSQGVPTSTPESTISSGAEGMIEKYDLDKLISMSDSIIVGEVTEVLRSEWNTQDGKKPVNNGPSNIIYTDIRIKVGEYLKNPLDMTTITVRILGGIVGQDELDVEDQPSYEINEKVLVFLKKDDDARTKDVGGQHFVTVGAIQGKVSILQNNEIIVGDEKMSLDDLRVRITGKGTKNTTVVTN